MTRFHGFKYGAIAACISGIWMVYLFTTKSVISPMGRFSLLFIPLLLFVGCYFSIRNLRDKKQDGLMSFSDGLKTGLQTALAYSLVMAAATFVCQTIIYPEFTIDAIANAKAHGIAEKVDPKLMSEVLNKMKQDIGIGSQLTKTIFGGMLTGTIFSVLASLLMRK